MIHCNHTVPKGRTGGVQGVHAECRAVLPVAAVEFEYFGNNEGAGHV